jgi:Family of unknown function (DUF6744)
MNSVLPDYAAGLPDEAILGYIAWYTVTQPIVTHEQLEEMVADLPLSQTILPKAPRMGDAFKRACRYSERKKVPIPGSADTFANFLIRNVTQDADEVERHLVLEIVDEEGKRLEYHVVAQMTFNRTKSNLYVRQLQVDDNLLTLTKETLKMFTDNFDKATKYLDAQVLRLMVRQQLELMSATSVRAQGSVYFIPVASKEQTEGLETLCQRLGNGSAFHSLPLIDTTKQREMVKSAFEKDVHDQAAQLIAELTSKRRNGTALTAKAWEKYQGKFKKLKASAGDYATIVDDELDKVKIEIESLNKNLTEFLTEGLVK